MLLLELKSSMLVFHVINAPIQHELDLIIIPIDGSRERRPIPINLALPFTIAVPHDMRQLNYTYNHNQLRTYEIKKDCALRIVELKSQNVNIHS
jgi:hypothetical protein